MVTVLPGLRNLNPKPELEKDKKQYDLYCTICTKGSGFCSSSHLWKWVWQQLYAGLVESLFKKNWSLRSLLPFQAAGQLLLPTLAKTGV